MSYEQILFETKENVAWIRLNRPDKLNALTHDLSGEALDALEQCAKEPEIRAVVITGEGRGFSAGQDLDDLKGNTGVSVADHLRVMRNSLQDLFTRAIVAERHSSQAKESIKNLERVARGGQHL